MSEDPASSWIELAKWIPVGYGYGDLLWIFFLKIFQGHQWFLVDFFENCYTKCSKFRINLFIS